MARQYYKIDKNDPIKLKQGIKTLHARLQELGHGTEQTRQLEHDRLNADQLDFILCEADKLPKGAGQYYVYAHCNPKFKLKPRANCKQAYASILGCPAMPFYIGKGVGNRAYNIKRNETHALQMSATGKPLVHIIAENLSEHSSLALESFLIACFMPRQLHNKGYLTNATFNLNANMHIIRKLWPKCKLNKYS